MTVEAIEQSTPEGEILTVKQFLDLAGKDLKIPLYQRPYKWTEKNIRQLFSDVKTHKDKSSYRLGTIVFHDDGDHRNIVDGQQRTITLMLAVLALSKWPTKNLDRIDLKKDLDQLGSKIISLDLKFKNKISKSNINKNFHVILRIVKQSYFVEEHINFLLNKCELVVFTLRDVSEAFQFFDSQNTRGRDLAPHDLLKAYHLREFCPLDGDQLKQDTVATWESSSTEVLVTLFSWYLYRIRSWSTGASARYFGKEDIELFKGVNLGKVTQYPFVKQLQIVHNFVDICDRQGGLKDSAGFPFRLDQIIINGRRFFEMIAYYQKMIERYIAKPLDNLDDSAKNILDTIKDYEGSNRIGDRYIRMMFDCLLLYYIDKFGFEDISRAIEKIFIWAYNLRLRRKRIQLASIDNYVLEYNFFTQIRKSIRPHEFLDCTFSSFTDEFKSTRTEKIKELYREIKSGCYDE
ncbi:MAG: DUF262 domain-containing protein [Aestuariivita sp.]|nr:DUF262 domain-containing protein [Aestuariivita sp.]